MAQGSGPPTAGGAASRPGAPASAGATISGTVTVKPDLQARLAAGDTLFVFARAPEGPRMPIAAMRTSAKEFPFAFKLDDSLAMAGGPPLSSATSVVIEARVSKSGEARAQTGDLSGRSAVVTPGASGVSVVIDTVVP
jgi:cytochrome c-type biogenesis protein CcmH